jgi:hypothetical protein
MSIQSLKKVNLAVGSICVVWVSLIYLMELPFEKFCLNGPSLCYNIHAILIQVSGFWLFLLAPFFLFSVVLFFIKNEVYKHWAHFSYVWLPLSLVLISMVDSENTGGIGLPHPSDAAYLALLMVVIYVFISITIIIRKAVSKPGHGWRSFISEINSNKL